MENPTTDQESQFLSKWYDIYGSIAFINKKGNKYSYNSLCKSQRKSSSMETHLVTQ